jgi:hypothetical protein
MNVMISGMYSVTRVRTSGGSTFNALFQTYRLLHIVHELTLPSLSKREKLDTLFLRAVDNLVVNVSDIHYELSNITEYFNIIAEVVS